MTSDVAIWLYRLKICESFTLDISLKISYNIQNSNVHLITSWCLFLAAILSSFDRICCDIPRKKKRRRQTKLPIPTDLRGFSHGWSADGFTFVSVNVLDEGTRWWPAGSDCKPPGQSAETTEERSHPALTPEIYNQQEGSCVMSYLASLLSPTTFLLGIYPIWTCKKRVIQPFAF